MVWPAFNPRYAFAAPSTTQSTNPRNTARTVNSFMLMFSGTKGRCGVMSDDDITTIELNFPLHGRTIKRSYLRRYAQPERSQRHDSAGVVLARTFFHRFVFE